MSDEEWWRQCVDPQAMLVFLEEEAASHDSSPSERKLKLLACACCRCAWPLLDDQRSRHAIETCERFADRLATQEELGQAQLGAHCAAEAIQERFVVDANETELETSELACAAAELVWWAASTAPDVLEIVSCMDRFGEVSGLLRDIFGNPFRPMTLDPRWLTASVLDLARAIYDERAFERMPVLADALMDAGCDSGDIINHCRGDGPHVRGCWVVDLILGKE